MRLAVNLVAIVLFATPLAAQANPAQGNFHAVQPRPADDASLSGMKTVYLTAAGNDLDSATFQNFELELRKSGIRVVSRDHPADAQMFVSASKLRCGVSGCDALFTIEVIQPVKVLRLGRPQQSTTWLSDALGLGVVWDQWLRATAKLETDAFLNRWLSANGR
jgi:hypothetical protein